MKCFFQPELFFIKTWKIKIELSSQSNLILGKDGQYKRKRVTDIEERLPIKMHQFILSQKLSVYFKSSSC